MNEILPAMHIPALRTARLARTVAHYRDDVPPPHLRDNGDNKLERRAP